MYKDVWKKFGVKLLIVLCSVLLLGGVAIAAPSLRADDTKPNLNQVQAWVNVSNAAITVTGSGGGDVSYVANSDGIYPSTIKVTRPDGKEVTIYREDYDVVTDKTTGDPTKAGNVTITIQTKNTLPTNSQIANGGSFTFTYTILPAVLSAGYDVAFETNAHDPIGANATDLVVANETMTISKTNIKRVYLAATGQPDIEIDSTRYEVAESSTTGNKNQLGVRTIDITLKDYKQSGSGTANQVWTETCTVVKDIQPLVKLDTDGSIVVQDGSTVLTLGTHYTQSGEGTAVTVNGKRDGGYVGQWVHPGGGNQEKPIVAFAPEVANVFDTGVLEYGGPGGANYKYIDSYKFQPKLIIENENNLPLDYEKYTATWEIVDNYDEKIPGATAGTVLMTVTIKAESSKYDGKTATLKYRVRRNIADAVFEEPDEKGDYDYAEGVTHKKQPKIQFNDADAPLPLRNGTDITVKYYFKKRNGTTYKEPAVLVENPTDAGMVYIVATGNLGSAATGTSGGYYGTLSSDGYKAHQKNGRYEIKAKPFSNNQSLRLLQGEGIREFPVSNDEPKIGVDGAAPAYIYSGGNDYVDIDPNDKGAEYNVYFFRDESCTQPIDSTEWGNLPVDQTYYVQYSFIGNLDGKLTAPFKLHAYKKDEVDIAFETGTDGCDGGTECNLTASGGGHIYNGRAHKPEIVVTANGTGGTTSGNVLTEGIDYDKTYSEDTTNVNSTKIAVIVTLKGSGDIKEKTFTISPLSINNDASNSGNSDIRLALPGEYSGNPLHHEYSGRTNRPKLKSLTFSKAGWDGEGGLNNLLDYDDPTEQPEGAQQDFSVVDLYEWDGTTWKKVVYSSSSKPTLKLNTNYRFQVQGVGNCVGTGYTDTFQFSPRDINKAEFINQPTVMEEGTKDTKIAEILAFLTTEASKVRLRDLGDELEYGDNGDFIIYIGNENNEEIDNVSDLRSTYGLIEYTIVGKGCYAGSNRKETLYIGKNIADTDLWEMNKIISVNNGVRKLDGSYGPNEADLPFWKGDHKTQDPRKTIYLKYNKGLTSDQKELVYDNHYTVEVGDPQDRNPGQPGGQYCTVTVQGINGYYGTTTFEYNIITKNIAKCTVLIERVDYWQQDGKWVYTGEKLEPQVLIFPESIPADECNIDNLDKALVLDKDYKVDYTVGNCIKANEDAGQDKAKIKIIGLSVYSGTETTVEFTIYKRELNSTVNVSQIAPYFKLRETDGSIGDGERLGGTYEYRTTSKVLSVNGGTETANGVCPQFEIFFDPTGKWEKPTDSYKTLEYGKDFKVRYNRNTHVFDHKQENVDLTKSPVVIVDPMGTNFKGSFEVPFDIQPIKLEECVIKLVQSNIPFTGSPVGEYVKGLVEVYQREKDEDGNYKKDENGKDVLVLLPMKHREGDEKDTTAPEVIEYEIFVKNDLYVPNLSNPQTTGMPYVWIQSTAEGNCIGKLGDDGSACTFYIVGDLARDKTTIQSAIDNTEVLWDTTEVEYSKSFDVKTALTEIQNLRFRQKEDAPNAMWFTNYLGQNDYDISLDAYTIGEYLATVTGKVLYEKSIKVPVVVYANLGNKDYMSYEYPETFSYVTGSAIDFKKLIKVKCGNDYLTYGKHYRFVNEDELDAVPGTGYSVTIEPVPVEEGGVSYVKGTYSIKYDVKAGLDNSAQITMGSFDANANAQYEYAHGASVFNPSTEIKVTVGGTPLIEGTDYKIEIDGDLVNCGKKTVKVIGLNSYQGTATRDFTIYEYDIAQHTADMRISPKSSVVYSGKEVFPDMDVSVVVSGTLNKLKASDSESEEAAGEYTVERDTGDTVNWTHDPNKKPTFAIQGIGNYTGRITGNAYSITRKSINDPDVDFPGIDPESYRNGAEVRIVPKGTFNGKDLKGEEYNANNPDKYLNAPGGTSNEFTYKYTTQDLRGVGTKNVTIEGIGNFEGKRQWSYEVVALQLSEAVLELDDSSVIYDGRKQTPAFKLIYGNVTIAEFTGAQMISEMINNLKYEFTENTDAGTATVRVWVEESDNDNYKGEKKKSFTIHPASLANHTKFAYRPADSGGEVDLGTYELKLPFANGSLVRPQYAVGDADGKLAELPVGQVGIYYNYAAKRNHGDFLVVGKDYEAEIEYKYVQPDTEDEDVREEDYPDPNYGYAGKVRVTITGTKNYTDSASFWYFIGKDISSEASISMSPLTAVYNSRQQTPIVEVTGIKNKKEYKIVKYRNEITVENIIEDKDFVNAGTYYIRIEGSPANGTYSTKPHTLTYTITPRAISSSVVIDGFKREYSYTGYDICPVGISVTDYIDNVKYRLTEDTDYTLTYTNNLNAGTAYINIKGQNNFSGTATASFMITSSTISNGNYGGSNSFIDQGIGEISGSTAVSPGNVNLTMDTNEAMYYTGKALYPKVSISGMTENVDYTVTFSNNVEVGTGVVTVNGIGNNTGAITKNFRIIAQLSKCTISPIPAQQHTGSPVTPALTVTCGNNILMEGTDYSVSYSNNVNIGTATATIRALNNANYIGTATATFSIGNDVGGFIISGFAPTYTYTGKAITPGVVVETGSTTLTQGTDYTVSYSNNTNVGTATITVTGTGKYSGTQTANFVIEAKSIQSCDTTEVADRTYTGDAYTPSITVSDGDKVLQNGVDYTVTYTNNTNPGMASVLIQGTGTNYSGTKVVSFKISAVAVKGLKTSSISYNYVKLKWTKQDYADGYQVCDSNSKVVKTVTSNSAKITGLSAGKTYKYKVRSYIRNTDGTKSYGAFSSVLSATTKLKTPTVKVVSNATGQARISWSKVSGASGYEIYYKKSSGEKYKKLKTVNNANIRVCTVRGMKSGDRAYFRVRAFRKSGSKKVYSALNPLKVITVK